MQRIHPAWLVAVVTAGALLAAAAFRSTTGVLIEPIMHATGWPMSTPSGAASLNLILYGVATPFAAAVMQTWGVRRTVVTSLAVVTLAAVGTCAMTAPWQLWLLWGVFIGVGTGALALTFGTIVANRWFDRRRNLVTGVFSAATAAGQVLFVPLIARVAAGSGWKAAELVVAGCSLATALACLVWLRDRPADLGVTPYGAGEAGGNPPPGPLPLDFETTDGPDDPTRTERPEPPLRATMRVLASGARSWSFWALLFTFFVCGWSTNGIVVTDLVPAAHDHAMPPTTAASLIGVIGVFDVIGTLISGWLTDRCDARVLLAAYYITRGLSLVFVNGLLGPHVDLPLWGWVIFYGLDWTATVPPTVALFREIAGLADSGVAFGWAYAAHMIGAGLGASLSGALRSGQGTYREAWMLAAGLCLLAGVVALTIRRVRQRRSPAPVVTW